MSETLSGATDMNLVPIAETAVSQAYKQGYNDAQADVFPIIERLEKKVDAIGGQLNWTVTTVQQFIEAVGKSPMANMFGRKN